MRRSGVRSSSAPPSIQAKKPHRMMRLLCVFLRWKWAFWRNFRHAARWLQRRKSRYTRHFEEFSADVKIFVKLACRNRNSSVIYASSTAATPTKTKQSGRVAQLVEQGIENPRVGGSIPSSATKISRVRRNASPFLLFVFGGLAPVAVVLWVCGLWGRCESRGWGC